MQQHSDTQFVLDAAESALLINHAPHNVLSACLESGRQMHIEAALQVQRTSSVVKKQGKRVSDVLLHKLPEWG